MQTQTERPEYTDEIYHYHGTDHRAVGYSWEDAAAILGHEHRGTPEDDDALVAAILDAGGPEWVRDASGTVDDAGWWLLGPEAAGAREPARPNAPTASLTDLINLILEIEQQVARGSETTLWGDYCKRMREVTGVLPYSDCEGDPQVPLDEAAWWLGAYERAVHMDLGLPEGADRMPVALSTEDLTGLGDALENICPALDRDGDPWREWMQEGYEWAIRQENDAAREGMELRARRERMGLTQVELAERLDPPSTQNMISRYESGDRRIPAGFRQALAALEAEVGQGAASPMDD